MHRLGIHQPAAQQIPAPIGSCRPRPPRSTSPTGALGSRLAPLGSRFGAQRNSSLRAASSRTRVQRAQRRKFTPQPGSANLKNANRGRQIPQPPPSQIQQINSAEQTRGRLGQQDLAAVAGRHHPRGPIQHRTEVVRLPELRLAGGQSHPDRQLKLLLRGKRGVDGRSSRGECCTNTIAGVLERPAPMRFDRAAQHLVMGCQGGPHALRISLPPTGRTLDIGEQERHDARWRVRRGHQQRIAQLARFQRSIARTARP